MNIKNKIYDLIKVIVLFLWMIMMFYLIRNNYPLKLLKNDGDFKIVDGSSMKEEWMGIYYNDKKIGYSHWMIIPDKDKNIFIINEQSYMNFIAGGENIEMKLNNTAFAGSDYKLKEFTAYLFASKYKSKITGKINGNNLDIKYNFDKTVKEYSVPIKEIPTITSNLNQYISSKGLIVGRRYVFPYYDPFTLSGKNMKIYVEKKEKVEIYGEYVDAYKIKEDYDGIIIYTWLKEDGTRLKEESPMGFILKRERQDDAINIPESKDKADIIKSTSVDVEKKINEPRKVKYLKLEINGININGFSLLNEGRQKMEGNTLEIFTMPIKEEKSDIKEYLSSGIFIQSDDSEIRNKAREITGNEDDVYKKAGLISRWLFNNIKKKVTVSIPDAVSILRTKTGDCNEHATLFCALARAAGIPAKICVGLIYSEKGFYYHAWNEIYAEDKWISVDSVFDQLPADATHVKFIEGELDKQMELLKIIGRIQIKVLEYK